MVTMTTDSHHCRDCRAGLEHCHGTLIHHVQQAAECTEDGCPGEVLPHSFALDCEAVGCRCAQVYALAI